MRYDEKRLDYPLIFQSLYADMASESKSPRATRYTNSILSAAFKQAVKDIELPRQKQKEVKILTASHTRQARPS